MQKIKVGQKLFHNRNGKIITETVERVGKKYFWLKNHIETFFVDNLREETDKIRLYLTKQETIDDHEYSCLLLKCRKFFNGYFKFKEIISLDQLRKIDAIIKERNE